MCTEVTTSRKNLTSERKLK